MSNNFDVFDNFDTSTSSNSKIKKRHLFLLIIIFLLISALYTLIVYTPKRDSIVISNIPDTYIIENENNYVAFQKGDDCSGYSTAYVLRHLGENVQGDSLYQEMPKIFGKVALSGIRSSLQGYGYDSVSYTGNIDTLKMRLNEGNPIIALITINIRGHNGLHYVAIVGYDSNYIYMADSTEPKTNIYNNKIYNRKVTYEEFIELWQTNIYPVNNIYTIIKMN